MPPDISRKLNAGQILILFSCLLVVFSLRYFRFDHKSLWGDEIYTFNDSRYGVKEQLQFYEKYPTFLHPPLFFILTHSFYPFAKPERDLRIIPLISGTLSIPMIYLLARSFSPMIALPCTLSLVFMTYHISLSQDGRSYSFLLFLGMTGLYFFMRHLKTLKKRYLVCAAVPFALMLHTSYSSIPFVVFSQILWLYRIEEVKERPPFSSFLIFNGLIFLFCLPWFIFVVVHYKGQIIMDPFHTEDPGPLWSVLYGVLSDWAPLSPLIFASLALFILYPLVSKDRKNAFVLLAASLLPIAALYSFCKLLNVTHFITSRYFISFLPFFFITLFLSLWNLEVRFEKLPRFLRLRLLFVILLIASNLMILPLYYRSEKQDLRGLVTYLKSHLRERDKIIDLETMATLGILHYMGAKPEGRRYKLDYLYKTDKDFEYRKYFFYRNRKFIIYHSNRCCTQYIGDESRLWIITSKRRAKEIEDTTPSVLKGYFDGAFANMNRFPTDASMYLFLWDPRNPNEKGIEVPIE